MKKFKLSLIVLMLMASVFLPQKARTQTPQKMSYQAVIRDASSQLVTEQDVGMQISILQGSSSGTAVYVETQTPTTNANGLVSIEIGEGTTTDDFSAIDWSAGTYFIKTETDPDGGTSFTITGVSQLLSVPYALFASKASNAESLGTDGVYSTNTDTLFVVKDHDGNVVFAVFPDGAQVIVNETAKGKVGGFAISGRSPSKSVEMDIFRVTADSTRIYVNDTVNAKGKVGGFAVSGRSPSKNNGADILYVTADSTRIYLNEDTEGKGKVGGFAVSGRSPSKGTESDYFNISGNTDAEIIDPSEARILWYPNKEAFMAGRVLVESPDSVGLNSWATGFESKSIGNYSQALGYKARAFGNNSTAIGNNAIVDSANSYALGNNTYVGGVNSYALGDSAYAIGENSYAIGAGARALGEYSFALGSHGVLLVDEVSYQVGAAKADADFSYALGNSISNGVGGIAIGMGNTASGNYSLAMGFLCSTEGEMSTAIGNNNKTIGNHATALGVYTTAEGTGSTTMGYLTLASGTVSTAMGWQTLAKGEYSTTMGYNTIAVNRSETAIGQFNDTTYSGTIDHLFTVGNGVDSLNRSNALMVLSNGNTGIGGFPGIEGSNVLAINTGSVPGDTIPDGILLYAEDINESTVLQVMNGKGDVTTLSPHSFILTEKSEPMAWSFLSENKNEGYKINVDMLKAIRTIENISGEKLVYLQDLETKKIIETESEESLLEIINQQQKEIEELKQKLNEIFDLLEHK